jgi:hypothetical protein
MKQCIPLRVDMVVKLKWFVVQAALTAAQRTQGVNKPLQLDDHVDTKGNTLLHITWSTRPYLLAIINGVNLLSLVALGSQSLSCNMRRVVGDPEITRRILQDSDCDPNATNDKRFTPLMMASNVKLKWFVDTLCPLCCSQSGLNH